MHYQGTFSFLSEVNRTMCGRVTAKNDLNVFTIVTSITLTYDLEWGELSHP